MNKAISTLVLASEIEFRFLSSSFLRSSSVIHHDPPLPKDLLQASSATRRTDIMILIDTNPHHLAAVQEIILFIVDFMFLTLLGTRFRIGSCHHYSF